eukprot:5405417-Karenia_brevis.AAC.1
MALRSYMPCSNEELEGWMSLARVQSTRARNIGLPLLGARCNSKKALHVASAGIVPRMSNIAPRAAQ